MFLHSRSRIILLIKVWFIDPVGHKNSNKAPVTRVVSITEEPIIVPRRPHTRTVRPRQWHISKGGPTIEKKLWRGD